MIPQLIRQYEIIPENVLHTEINIIGAGAIGSFTTLALAKMGFFRLTVWDPDKIEIENMNCQFYRVSDIESNKAQALNSLVKDFTGIDIAYHPSKYEQGTLSGIVISAVDSMAVRKQIWENHKHKLKPKLIIDPRMGAEFGLVFAMKPAKQQDIDAYETQLYSDEEAVTERCTAKATMYTACMLSGHVAKIVKDFLANSQYSRITQWDIGKNAMQAFPEQS